MNREKKGFNSIFLKPSFRFQYSIKQKVGEFLYFIKPNIWKWLIILMLIKNVSIIVKINKIKIYVDLNKNELAFVLKLN